MNRVKVSSLVGAVLTLTVLFFSVSWVEAKFVPHSSKELDGKSIIRLKTGMSSLESNYLNLQILMRTNPIDYTKVMKNIADMENTIRKIRMVNVKKPMDKPLETLSNQVYQLNKFAQRQNPMVLQKRIDKLYENCFRCHATHAPPMR